MTKIKLKTNKTKKSRLYSLLKYVKLRISKGGFEPPTFVWNDALTPELQGKHPNVNLDESKLSRITLMLLQRFW